MGIVVTEVIFDAPAPTATKIAARVEEIVGLPLVVRDSSPEIKGSLFDLDAQLAFAVYPRSQIEVTAYRAGAVREHLRLTGVDVMPIADVVQGSNEATGQQTVYVEGYVGQEPTLLLATTFALETLGGRLGKPMPDHVRRDYGQSVSVDELRRRYRKVQRQGLLALAAGVVLLPILVPIWMISIGRHLVERPARILKAKQVAEEHLRRSSRR